MNIASGPSLVVEDIPSILELRAAILCKQARAGRATIQAEHNRIDQTQDKSKNK